MNVFFLGNGFDLFYKLPTQYCNFLNIVNLLRNTTECNKIGKIGDILSNSELREKDHFAYLCYEAHVEIYDHLIIHENEYAQLIDLTENNIWFQYFIKMADQKTGWVDFEQEILRVIYAFKKSFESFENIDNDFFINVQSDADNYIIEQFPFFRKCVEDDGRKDTVKRHKVLDTYVTQCPYGTNIRLVNKEKIVNELFGQLERFSEALKLYLNIFVNQVSAIRINAKPKSKRNLRRYDAFSCADAVITLNYTNTYENLYCNKKIYHLHGNIRGKIVLGVNSDIIENDKDNETLFLPFEKCYQRTLYETDLEYLEWIREISKSSTKDTENVKLIVMGHSLDITDKDIILPIFEIADEIYILYHDKQAKARYIKNLIKIFGMKRFQNMRINKNIQFLIIDSELSVLANVFKPEKMGLHL